MRQPLRARIGVWGTFDLDSLGDQLRLSVLSHELARRLPGATIRAFAPYGYLRPTRLDGGEPAEPLGAWSEDRAAELAAELDCVIVAGVELHGLQGGESLASRYGVDPEEVRRLAPDRFFIEGLGPELEGRCPIVWSSVGLAVAHDPELASRLAAALSSRPHISVRDEISRARLEATGVTRTIEVVPDPALLAPRLYPASLLEKRLEYLRLMEWYPRRGGALVLQASKNLASQTTHLTAALRPLLEGRDDLSLVIARVDPGDEALAGASHFALPAAAGAADLLAAISASSGFIGDSLGGHLAAAAYGVPQVVLNFDHRYDLSGLAELWGAPDRLAEAPEAVPGAYERAVKALLREGELAPRLVDRIDSHLDAIAGIAREAAMGRAELEPDFEFDWLRRLLADREGYLEALRRAHEARGWRLAAERVAFADHVRDLRAEIAAKEARAEAEVALARREALEARGREEAAVDELEALLATRTFRYTAALRKLYARLRARAG